MSPHPARRSGGGTGQARHIPPPRRCWHRGRFPVEDRQWRDRRWHWEYRPQQWHNRPKYRPEAMRSGSRAGLQRPTDAGSARRPLGLKKGGVGHSCPQNPPERTGGATGIPGIPGHRGIAWTERPGFDGCGCRDLAPAACPVGLTLGAVPALGKAAAQTAGPPGHADGARRLRQAGGALRRAVP